MKGKQPPGKRKKSNPKPKRKKKTRKEESDSDIELEEVYKPDKNEMEIEEHEEKREEKKVMKELILEDSDDDEKDEEEPIKNSKPKKPRKTSGKKKNAGKKTEPTKKKDSKAKKDEYVDKRKHGQPFNGCTYFDPARLGDASDSEDEKPAIKKNLEKYGRTKAFRRKDKTVYVVKNVLKEEKVKGKVHYLVKWKGLPPSEDTLEPADACTYLDAYITYANKQKTDGTARWTPEDDKLLCKLTKKKGYRKKTGGFDFYKFAKRFKQIFNISSKPFETFTFYQTYPS
eukprot:UN31136